MSFRFGDCVVDPSCFQLRRGDRPVKIEPRVFDVLLHLIEHADRVVTKQELLEALWPGEAVSDSVLPRCIAAARRAVGDTRARQEVIATVHGRGYRFVAPLEQTAGAPAPAAPAPAPAAPTGAASDSEFVGRSDALERLDALVARTERGQGAVALIVGEPGIGKTRLAEELAERAGLRGFEVLTGRCYEGEGAPAYWPWVQILREATAATTDDATLRAQLGRGAPELGELVPELRERVGDLPAPAGGGSNQARFRLYDAATQFLTTRAREHPLLLVLDDLHWADASSLGLLRFLARPAAGARILVLGTYRDVDVRRGHPLAGVLGALARETRSERLALTGLEPIEIASLVERLAGVAPEPRLLARLHEMTDGNPFFLHEIVRLIADRDLSQVGDRALDALALPQGVKDAIGRRLDALSPECNDVLRSAAVLGREFGLALLEAMHPGDAQREREALLELLGEALDAGVIVESAHGRYAFSHALTRQTLYEELRSPQRIALHRRAGAAIERAWGAGSGELDRHAELAHHFFEAAPGGDVDKAIRYAVAAAESCHRAHAYDEAVNFHERALEALELAVPVDETRRAELTLALGQARFVAGARDLALHTLRGAADLARPLGRVDLMAQAAIAIRGFGEMGTLPEPGVTELLHECLEVLPDDQQALRASLLSRLNGAAAMSMDERHRLARQAVEIAECCEDPVSLRDAYGALWWATLGPDRLAERDALGRKLRALAERTGDPRSRLQALECDIGASLLRGDRGATERSLDEFEQVARELRQPVFVFMGMHYRTSWLITRGQYDEAAERVEAARQFGRGVVPFADAVCSGQMYWARSSRGLPTEMDLDVLDRVLSETFTQRSVSRAFLASLQYSVDGDAAHAIELIDGLDLDTFERDENWLMALSTLAWLAVEVSHRDLVEWLYSALRPYGELIAIHDLLRAGYSSVASSLGLLACELGDLDVAVELYEQAIERERRADMMPALVGSRLGLAWTLRQRGAAGDRARADDLAGSGEAACENLGLGPFSRPRILLERLDRL